MLRRYHDRGRRNRLVLLVSERHLAFRIRAEQRLLAAVPRLRQRAQNVVRELDGRRHQLRGLVAGIAEHDSLVARALVLVGAGIDPASDVGGLGVQMNLHIGTVPVEAVLLVADVTNGLPDDLVDALLVDDGLAAHQRVGTFVITSQADLAGEHDAVGRDQGLARNAGMRIGREKSIDNGVGDAVADLVGMAFRYGFAGEQI